MGEHGVGIVLSQTSRVRSSLKFEVFSKMFIGVEFAVSYFIIFGGFGWVHILVLVGKPGFERVQSREGNFLGFEFLTRNEEKNEFPHEERGIFEEFFLVYFPLK